MPIPASHPPCPTGAGWFTTTHWSVVLAAGDAASPRADAALEQLCRAYWYPLYAFIRRRGHDAHQAQDLTQAFFADLLARQSLASAQPEKGRFRSFLLGAVQNFLAKERERARTLKRGGHCTFLSLDEEDAEGRYRREPAHDWTPEKLFERRWALTLLDHTLAALRDEHRRAGKLTLFEALESFLSVETTGYAAPAAALGMSEGAVRVAVHRLRRRYGELLRAGIAQTLASPDEVEAEMAHLFEVLRG
jgi:RNA polymerase sigma-70 factor (ECF subfamily)